MSLCLYNIVSFPYLDSDHCYALGYVFAIYVKVLHHMRTYFLFFVPKKELTFLLYPPFPTQKKKNSRWKTVQELFSLCFWYRLTQKHSFDLLCLNCFQASDISVSFQYAFPSVRPCEHLYIYQCMLSQCPSMSVCILMKQLLKCSTESLSIALTLGLILGNKIQSQFNTGEQR